MCHRHRPSGQFFNQSKPWLTLVMLISLIAVWTVRSYAGSESPHILILNSYHAGYRGTDDIARGFRQSVIKVFPKADIKTEYLDSKYYSGTEYDTYLDQFLSYKYQQYQFDLIFAADDYAFNFVEKNKAHVFPEQPIVFCGTNEFDVNRLQGKENFYGVDERPSFQEGISLIFSLRPDTKKIIVIYDDSITGQINSRAFRTAANRFSGEAEFEYLSGQSFETLLERVKNLDDDTVIFYFASFVKNKDGELYSSSDALKILSANCPVPIFGGWEFSLGHGIVGGKLIDLFEHGSLAGRIAVDILNDKAPQPIAKVFPSPNIFMFDDRELQRFHIQDQQLPVESKIINRPPSFYQQYAKEIFFALSVVLGTLVIFSFIYIYRSKKLLQSAYREQQKSLQTITQEKETAQSYLDIAGVMLGALNRQGDIILMNKKGHQIFGYPDGELIGQNWFEICLPVSIRSQLKDIFTRHISGELKPLEFYENVILNSAGEERIIAFHNTLIGDESGISGFLFSGEDITERKLAETTQQRLELQLRQKHKMEAVGYMAGGMAHNFNNNLSIILGNLELSKMKSPRNSKIGNYLDNAEIAVLRSRDLVNQIITYSRKGIHDKAPMKLRDVIDETIQLLSVTLPTTIKIDFSICSNCGTSFIYGDPSQIQEVLINLCNNAFHAMKEKGELNISVEPAELAKDDIPLQYDASPGRHAKLSVQDTGEGVPDEFLDKIFDPFFSTKEEYEGAGMGLATVQGIVVQHKGLIKVHSILGQGTTFEIYFPLVDGAVPEEKPINADKPKGRERILFVDDDKRLAEIGGEMLTAMGYQVTLMTESQEALKLFASNPKHFDMIFTDQTMPELTGKELIQKVKEIQPDIPIIICTGYSSMIDEEEAKKLGADAFLMKPLDLPVLLQTIRQVMDEDKEI